MIYSSNGAFDAITSMFVIELVRKNYNCLCALYLKLFRRGVPRDAQLDGAPPSTSIWLASPPISIFGVYLSEMN